MSAQTDQARPATEAVKAELLARLPERYKQGGGADQVGPERHGRIYSVAQLAERRGIVSRDGEKAQPAEVQRERRTVQALPPVTELTLDAPEKEIRVTLSGRVYTLALIEPELQGGAMLMYWEQMVNRRLEELSGDISEERARTLAAELKRYQMEQITGLLPSILEPENAPLITNMRPSVFRALHRVAQQFIIEAFGTAQETGEISESGESGAAASVPN